MDNRQAGHRRPAQAPRRGAARYARIALLALAGVCTLHARAAGAEHGERPKLAHVVDQRNDRHGRSASSTWYGINGHLQQGGFYLAPPQTQAALLRELGITVYRTDVSHARGARVTENYCEAFRSAGIQIVPVITIESPPKGVESAAYDEAYAVGRQVAGILRQCVTHYEVGNEYENKLLKRWTSGDLPNHYKLRSYNAVRGLIRGLIAGIRSVQPSAKIVSPGASWVHLAFYQMLWDGTAPDGSDGHPPVRWDVTAWHWYSDMGDITDARGYNVLHELKTRFGRPIWISELGFRPNGSDAAAGEYLVRTLEQLAVLAAEYDVTSVQIYQLYGDGESRRLGGYGLVRYDGKTPKGSFRRLKAHIASHPPPAVSIPAAAPQREE